MPRFTQQRIARERIANVRDPGSPRAASLGTQGTGWSILDADHPPNLVNIARRFTLLDDWHLDLSTGQYRRSSGGKPPGRALKLVYHVVLSMPAPTPPEKVLAAAKKFGREKFGTEHR